MPIPPFNSASVLPPHVGAPTVLADVSPYRVSIVDVCQRYATTPERASILKGLLELRRALFLSGIIDGFQQIDGSFAEDIETSESRSPEDVDFVTYCWNVQRAQFNQLVSIIPYVSDRDQLKLNLHVDHFFVNAGLSPSFTIEASQYWYGLFSHRRDGVWKGMLRVELNTPREDDAALRLLSSVVSQGSSQP